MKKTILLITLTLISVINISAQNKNDEAKAYYIEAEKDYGLKKYQSALNNLNKVEDILGSTNARVLALKVKSFYNTKDYKNAGKMLNQFSNYNSSEALKNEILSYIIKIDNKLAEAKIEKEKNRIAERERNIEAIEQENAEILDNQNWRNASTNNTVGSYLLYLNNEENKLYRDKAKLNYEDVFLNTEKGLEEFVPKFGIKDTGKADSKYNWQINISDEKQILFEFNWRGPYNKIEKISIFHKFKDITKFELIKKEKNNSYYLYCNAKNDLNYRPQSLPVLRFRYDNKVLDFFESLEIYFNSRGFYPEFEIVK